MLQQNYISKKSSELIGQEDSSMDKKEKFLYEDSSNEDLNIKTKISLENVNANRFSWENPIKIKKNYYMCSSNYISCI